MEYNIEDKKKGEVVLRVEFTADELKAELPKAAEQVSEHVEIKGFRKGKAPLDQIIQKVGEMTVYERAAEILVRRSYSEILSKEKVEPITQPKIDFEKLVPGNEFVYTATFHKIPEVVVGNVSEIKVKDVDVNITDEAVQKVVDDLKEYTAQEAIVDRAAKMGDKVELDFDVFRDGVPIEGGQGQKYPLILGKGQMIPGFEEEVVGMKSGEEKEFELAFPKEYHNKSLAGKKATFKVKVHGVYERTLPESNDAFAVMHGKKTFKELEDAIRDNLSQEEEAKQNQRLELEILEQLIKKSKFDEIPDVLVNQELDKMLQELKSNVMRQGMDFEQYLKSVQKDETTLRLDLAGQALDRVKAALLTRAIFLNEKMDITSEELAAELAKYKQMYAGNKEMEEMVDSDRYKEMLTNVMGNSKVMKYLKDTVQLDKK